MTAIQVREQGDLRLTISFDEFDDSPREWANFGTMLCFHNRYDLGDKGLPYREQDYEGWEEVRQALVNDGAVGILPLALYDHGIISISVGSGGGWDSGQVGFIYATPEAIAANGWTVEANAADIERVLRAEVDTYDRHLRGEVYAYTVERAVKCDCCGHTAREVIDSCGGFYDLADLYDHAGWDREAVA